MYKNQIKRNIKKLNRLVEEIASNRFAYGLRGRVNVGDLIGEDFEDDLNAGRKEENPSYEDVEDLLEDLIIDLEDHANNYLNDLKEEGEE